MILAIGAFSGGVHADLVAAFDANGSTGAFSGLSSADGVSGLSYTAGSGLNNYGYLGSWATVAEFSRESLLTNALADDSYLEFSFQTAGGTQITALDQFYMDNDIVVTVDSGVTTFKMGLAYDNGSGSFSELISDIDPQDINAGIDISGFSAADANSTVRFRVGFYDDVRDNPHSALYVVNSTLGGVDDSAAVFTGTVIPEPATSLLLLPGVGGILAWRRRRFALKASDPDKENPAGVRSLSGERPPANETAWLEAIERLVQWVKHLDPLGSTLLAIDRTFRR
ncbi:hypothetical protein L21SP4_00035 [Kiritimatiella glycovorans]|uniref:PEP-CTERM protein-sorting domain-containing protein n=2 Tax=Kiritimatiella glycovorans TaxID=1307763 RepID=A0A0G3EGS6_9BACT|nr:hypothetical protein L21SP4_00035 [Kiritimatiella glycovorans]